MNWDISEPGDRMGMLDAQAFRTIRVIIDIGMHLQPQIPKINPLALPTGGTLDSRRGVRVHDGQLFDR